MSAATGSRGGLPAWRRARRAGYSLLARGLLGLVGGLPAPAASGTCRTLARIAFALRGREREQAMANLRLVFPDWPEARRRKLLAESVDLLGKNLRDALALESFARDDFAAVADDGATEVLERARDGGRGVLILTGHFGCWELLGAWLARRLDGLTVVTGTVHNPPIARLLAERRRKMGMTPVPRQGDLRPLVRRLRAGDPVAVLMDQNTRVPNVDVPFCGVAAPTPAGFARLALRYRPAVVPLAIARDGGGHRIIHQDPLMPVEEDDERGRFGFLRRCNDALEEILRRNPAEWVWFHRRWEDAQRAAGDPVAPEEGP